MREVLVHFCRRALHVTAFLSMLLIATAHLQKPLWAQSSDAGALFGSVTDTTGAAVQGATVVVINTATESKKSLMTNSLGFYSAESMLSGDYKVTVAKQGFATVDVNNIHIDPGQRRDVSVALAVGSATEIVNVDANPLQVKTETSDVSSTIGADEISTLLTNGRNFQSLATLVPGVNNTNGNTQYSGGGLLSSTTISIGGTGVDNTTYLIDGVYNMNTGNYVNINITPSMDAISEFTVLKSNYSSRYGTSSSGVVMVNTKSGSSVYHGSAWDYLRNDALDASNYYSNGIKTALHQNTYGFSLGGPLQIPKLYNWDRQNRKQTFFFASDEWWSKSNGSSATTNVITQQMRTGDLAGSRGMPAGGLSLSPAGQQLLAAEGRTNCIASPTTLNPACLDTNALGILKAYQPTENANDPNFNFVNSRANTFSQIDHDYRVDHSFTPNETLMARVMYEQANNFTPFNPWNGSSVPTVTMSIFTTGLNAVARLTSVITPTIVNTFSAAETYDKPRLHLSNAPIPAGVTINQFFPDANASHSLPNIGVSAYDSFGIGVFPINASDGEGILNDDAIFVHGKHSFQVGLMYIFGIKNQNVFTRPEGSFTFDGTYTGSGAADFLLGLHDGYSQDSAKPHYTPHYRQIETYFQDDWKVNKRLTINWGSRFYYFSPDWLTRPHNGGTLLTSNFDFDAFQSKQAPVVLPDGSFVTDASGTPITSAGTAANLTNGLVYNTDPQQPRGFYNSRKVNIAPRVGFAYALTSDGRTSIHAGYGIGYVHIPFQILNNFSSNPPGVNSVSFKSGTLGNPTAGTAVVQVPRPQGLQLTNIRFRPESVQSFSAILEREVMRGSVFQVGYVGSLARQGRVNIDANQVRPVSAPFSASCLPAGQAPSASYDYDPCINAGSYLAGGVVQSFSQDFERPYSGWESMSFPAYEGSSHYHSLQSQFKYQSKGGVQATLNYTWSKVIGDATNGGLDFRTATSSVQNSYCISCEKGVINLDRPHIFSGNVIYQLPFFAHGSNGFLKAALGGWSVSGIVLAQSGFALTPSLAAPNTGLSTRPNQVGPIHHGSDGRHIFNADAFQIPKYGFFGNASNGSIRGPKEVAINMEISKTFDITERLKFQFQAQSFNIANHPSFRSANMGIGPNEPNPGLVNSPGDPRIMQVVGRVIF
jgi:hypothetical protein